MMTEAQRAFSDELQYLKESLAQRRAPWETTWKDVSEFCIPMRSFWDNTGEREGGDYGRQLYNTTAVHAVGLSCSGFIGATASRTSRFFRLVTTDADLMAWPGIADYLEVCERNMYAILNRSNFYEAVAELVPNGFTIGTAPLYIEDDDRNGRVIFQARHPKEIYVDEDDYGYVDTIIREYPISGKAALIKFGDKLPDDIRQRCKDSPVDRIMVQHIVLPSSDAYRDAFPGINGDMPYTSIWRLQATGDIIAASGYWEFPYPTWRYAKNSDETYGRSPAMDALSEILGGNQVAKSRLMAAQYTSDPAFLTSQTLQGRDRLVPGGRIYISDKDEQMVAIEAGKNYPITVDTERRIDETIERFFHTDIYAMLQQAQRQMTALEVDARMSEKAALLGPMTDRYNSEILAPAIKRTFQIAMRSGLIPPPPPIVIEQKATLDIDFIGYLSQLQKKHFQIGGMRASLEHIIAVAQINPETLDVVDTDVLMREGLDGHGAPQKAIRETDEVQQIRARRAQQQQAMMQAQAQQEVMGKIAGNTDPNVVPTEGSIVDQVMKGQA